MSIGLYAISLIYLLIIDDIHQHYIICFLRLFLSELARLLLLQVLLNLVEGHDLGGEGKALVGRLTAKFDIDATTSHLYYYNI